MSPTYINSMETYSNYISQFEIFDNPPCKEGFERHHIVPVSEQKKLYGDVVDNRQVYLTLPQHLWAHILYDREHGTITAQRLLNSCSIIKDNLDTLEDCVSYASTLKEKKDQCLIAQRTEESRQKMSNAKKGKPLSEEHRKNLSDSLIGRKRPPFTEEWKQNISKSNKGRKVWNKGKTNCFSEETLSKMSESHKGKTSPRKGTQVSDEVKAKLSSSKKGRKWFNNGSSLIMAFECPEGYVEGYLTKERRVTN